MSYRKKQVRVCESGTYERQNGGDAEDEIAWTEQQREVEHLPNDATR